MELSYKPQFLRDYDRLPQQLQKRLEQKLKLLLDNPRHPSLRVKKIEGIVKGYQNVFEGSINMNYRFLFQVEGDTYVLLRCGTHTKIFGR
jgi:mRNA interferase RelE/StbE